MVNIREDFQKNLYLLIVTLFVFYSLFLSFVFLVRSILFVISQSILLVPCIFFDYFLYLLFSSSRRYISMFFFLIYSFALSLSFFLVSIVLDLSHLSVLVRVFPFYYFFNVLSSYFFLVRFFAMCSFSFVLCR